MKLIRPAAALVLAAALAILAACESDSAADKNILFEVDGKPGNIDPQLAENDTELMIARNTFEGLCRIDEEGAPAPALAEDVVVEGNKYTFTLKNRLKWHDDTPLTSADVVFGLRRALLPETRAPFAQRLYSIKNARAVHEGTLPPDKLGVTAPDERTVVIELKSRDNDFLSVLADPVAMPCNEAFFDSTKGRYGLSAENILCNGAFYVRRWDGEEYVGISRNDRYRTLKVRPASVGIWFARDPKYRAARLDDGRCDAAVASSGLSDGALGIGLTPQLLYDCAWVIVLNPANKSFSDARIRSAFMRSVDHADYLGSMAEPLIEANALIPPGLNLRAQNFRDYAGYGSPKPYEPQAAKNAYHAAVAGGFSPDTFELLFAGDKAQKDVASRIAQSWQHNLGAVVNIREVTGASLEESLASGAFAAALAPVSSRESTAKGFLSWFDGGCPVSGVDVGKELAAANSALDDDKLLAKLRDIENKLLAADNLMPVVYDATCFVAGQNVGGIRFGPFAGRIDFTNAGKTG